MEGTCASRQKRDVIKQRLPELKEILRCCRLCPRECGINRLIGETGFCATPNAVRIASWHPHFGEEDVLVGTGGSGTIFFAHCNLGCIFCQNYSISHNGLGMEMTVDKLAEVMLSLQKNGCSNINLVTPTHVVPAIVEALSIALEQGLTVPVVYNCGGYESPSVLALLEGVVDIYMPDIKFSKDFLSIEYAGISDYWEQAKRSVEEMYRQVGGLVVNSDGVAVKGLLVRHLVLPNCPENTRQVLQFIAQEISTNTYINIMDQYRPCYRAHSIPLLARQITPEEFAQALSWAREYGLTRGGHEQ
ncbi:MAG: radical SAM protein [Candidatus Omnitrophica bacterium]|nr:radical SAM protein [Candidatus Omnitrophota bacterium]